MLRLLPKQARHEPLYYIQNPPTLASFYCYGHSQRRTCSGNNSGSGSFEFALVELAGASVELDEDVASHGFKGGGSRFGWAFGFGVASGPEGLKRQCKSLMQIANANRHRHLEILWILLQFQVYHTRCNQSSAD